MVRPNRVFNAKIAMPWPFLRTHQSRIKEPLSKWEDSGSLVLCSTRQSDDPFLKDFNTHVMPHSSADMGSPIPRCFLSDMLSSALSTAGRGWYGVGNSDIVPHDDFYEELPTFGKSVEVLVYHPMHLADWRQTFIAQPEGGKPCLILMRERVAIACIEQFLSPRAICIGAMGWAERLCGWMQPRFRVVRRFSQFYHKTHVADWDEYEVESLWNGGPLTSIEEVSMYDYGYVSEAAQTDSGHFLPRHAHYMLRKRRPNLYRLLQI